MKTSSYREHLLGWMNGIIPGSSERKMSFQRLFQKRKRGYVRPDPQPEYQRQCRLYCVGAAKTGTHSIDSMFNPTVRSMHEADGVEVAEVIWDLIEGRIQESDMVSYLRKRDERLGLDVDSSQLNFFLLTILLNEFPTARFLLTIRDCYSWLDSYMNHTLREEAPKPWLRLREYRCRANELSHPPEEQALKERGLYTLDGYLSYWASHIDTVLSIVPKHRLMIVKTVEIPLRAHEIAEFAGLPRSTIDLSKTHSFKNPVKYNVLQEIEKTYIEAKVDEHCGPLMKRFFPEINSIDRATL